MICPKLKTKINQEVKQKEIIHQVIPYHGYILNEVKCSVFVCVCLIRWAHDSRSFCDMVLSGGFMVWMVVLEMNRILDYQSWLPGQVTEREEFQNIWSNDEKTYNDNHVSLWLVDIQAQFANFWREGLYNLHTLLNSSPKAVRENTNISCKTQCLEHKGTQNNVPWQLLCR